MPLHAKADFVCTLIDKNDKELLKFKAAAASDLILSANYEGGGIASGGQALTVSTEREFNYQAFAHRVIALGDVCRKFGAGLVPQAFGRGRAHEKNIYSGAAMT